MLLHFLFGNNQWTAFLGICALGIIFGLFFFPTIITIFYNRFWYDYVLRKRFDPSYKPRCSIILPCKGVPNDLEHNLKAFLDLDYDDYEIIFTVESEQDSAFLSIKKLIAPYQKASLVVAGHATQCGQKNFNQLAAVNHSHDPEVYIFADADICPDKKWLKELVLPLSSVKVTAATGFRWNQPTKGTLGEYTHTYLNIFLYSFMTFTNFIGGVFLWGGSMAIRKKDFDDLKVAALWENAVVDDNSLSQILLKKFKKAAVVPACVTPTTDLLPTVKKSLVWFIRQTMYLKAHEKAIWFFGALPVALGALILFLWLPVSLVLSGGSVSTFIAVGGGATVLFYFGELFFVPLYPLLGLMPGLYKILFLEPFFRCMLMIAFLKTIFTNKILWSGIVYHLSFSGKVSKIERL